MMPPPDRLEPEIVNPIHPYQARKEYTCPGCDGIIAVGTGHVVVIPEHAADLRRHWHHGCWFKERRRRGAVTPGGATAP